MLAYSLCVWAVYPHIDEFQEFLKTEQCPLPVKLNYERAKVNCDLLKRGIPEAVAEEIESSAPYDGLDDPDTIDILNTAENMVETTNTLENLENSGLNIGRNYEWGKHLFQVRLTNNKNQDGDSQYFRVCPTKFFLSC